MHTMNVSVKKSSNATWYSFFVVKFMRNNNNKMLAMCKSRENFVYLANVVQKQRIQPNEMFLERNA